MIDLYSGVANGAVPWQEKLGGVRAVLPALVGYRKRYHGNTILRYDGVPDAHYKATTEFTPLDRVCLRKIGCIYCF